MSRRYVNDHASGWACYKYIVTYDLNSDQQGGFRKCTDDKRESRSRRSGVWELYFNLWDYGLILTLRALKPIYGVKPGLLATLYPKGKSGTKGRLWPGLGVLVSGNSFTLCNWGFSVEYCKHQDDVIRNKLGVKTQTVPCHVSCHVIHNAV